MKNQTFGTLGKFPIFQLSAGALQHLRAWVGYEVTSSMQSPLLTSDVDSACLTIHCPLQAFAYPPPFQKLPCPGKLETGTLYICMGAAWSLQPCLETSTALSQHKSASSWVHVGNGIPGTEQKTSGKESISQTVAQALDAQGSECWAEQDAWIGPRRFYLLALVPPEP